MPASQNSASGQLLTVTEITLVQIPPEESKGHRSAKGMVSAAPGQGHRQPSPTNCRHFLGDGGHGHCPQVEEIVPQTLPALPEWGLMDRGGQCWSSQHSR